jgi:hypothetical protein
MPARDPLTEPFAGLCGALRDLHEQVAALVGVHESIDAFNGAFGAFQDAMALHASCLQFPRGKTSLGAARPAKKASLPPAADAAKTPATGIPLPQVTSISRPSSVSPAAAAARNSSSASKAAGDKSGGGPRRPAAMKKKGVKVAAGTAHKTQQRGAKKKTPAPLAWTWEKCASRVCLPCLDLSLVCCFGSHGVDMPRTGVLEKVPKKYQSPQEIKKLENIILYIKNRGGGMCVLAVSLENMCGERERDGRLTMLLLTHRTARSPTSSSTAGSPSSSARRSCRRS